MRTNRQLHLLGMANRSRFNILTDTIDEETLTKAPESVAEQTNVASTSTTQKTADSLKSDSLKAKGKVKVNDFATAASNEKILEDIMPLSKEPLVIKKSQHDVAVKVVIGPRKNLQDITNLKTQSLTHPTPTTNIQNQDKVHGPP